MFVLKLPLLAHIQQLSVRSSSSHNFLSYYHYFTKCFKLVHRKRGYGNFDHQYNVSPNLLHALFGVRNFTKVVRMCANCL
jgi:hypothetical protein